MGSCPRLYLSKESFACARRTIHEDVPVEAMVLLRVSRCYGNITHTLFQERLRGGEMVRISPPSFRFYFMELQTFNGC